MAREKLTLSTAGAVIGTFSNGGLTVETVVTGNVFGNEDSLSFLI